MIRKLSAIACAIVVIGAVAPVAQGITWGTKVIRCPICQTDNTLSVPMSSGGYIFGWPSKYQVVYWPATESQAIHTCRQCGHSLLMAHFARVPADKVKEIRAVLPSVSRQFGDGHYTSIPASQRLKVAEKEYRVLGVDHFFWCHFYRMLGYHLEKEGAIAEAIAARLKALALAEKMLEDEARPERQLQLSIIVGAMRHFTGDDEGATVALKQGQRIAQDIGKEGLEEFIKEYLQKIQTGGVRPESVDRWLADNRGRARVSLWYIAGAIAVSAVLTAIAVLLLRARLRRRRPRSALVE